MDKQKGFANILIIILVLLIVGGGVYLYVDESNKKSTNEDNKVESLVTEDINSKDLIGKTNSYDTQHIKTQYDFVYTIEEFTQGVYGDNYSVEDGVLIKIGEVPEKLYIYSAKDGISRGISFEEAQKYYISPEKSSPEGYVFEYNDENNGYFIYKGNSKNKINIAENKYIENYQYFKRAVKFIGWIIE